MHYTNKKIANEVSHISQRIQKAKSRQPKKNELKLRFVNEAIPISVPSTFLTRIW